MDAYRTCKALLLAAVAAATASPAAALEAADDSLDIYETFTLDEPDRRGLRRDTLYFLGYQWVTIGLLYVAPEGVSGWTDEQKEGYDMSYWWDNVTNPQWDSDDFYLNYVLHPYWGASYYVRARERGYSDTQAFWYSALLSSLYEFGAEALFEEVSIQDVFVTPIGGALLGRYFMTVRDGIRDREVELGYRTRRDKWLWVMTDPLGALNGQFDRLTGRSARLRLRPYRYDPRLGEQPLLAPSRLESDPVYGIELRIEW